MTVPSRRVGARERPLVRFAAAVPGLPRTARAVARRIAGRHYVGAMAIVTTAVDADHVVLLARHRFRRGRWGVPSGWVRRREDPAAACCREVFEETGLRVRVDDILGCDLHAVDGVALRYGGLTVAYACHVLPTTQRDPRAGSVEIIETGWFTEDEAIGLVTGFEAAMISKGLRLACQARLDS
jgi:8-oxo-dGTP diphosphatase